MGQKTNLKTLRNLKNNNIITLDNNNLKKKFDELDFKRNIIHLFFKKKIIVTNIVSSCINNCLFLNLNLFFCSSTISFLKKKLKKKQKKIQKTLEKKNYIKFLNLFQKQFNLDKLILNTQVLNYKVSKKITKYIYFKNKKFINSLFSRRQQLFYDILKISTLFYKNLISSEILLKLLVLTFKILPKKKHKIFINFIKNLFNILVSDLFKKDIKKSIIGIKFLVNGKIGGKTRSSSNLIIVGNIPTQTISKNVNFCFCHANTIYGTFGFKLWTHTN
jgi:hypothetical protein